MFCKVSRERERAWRVLKNERERAWRFCYWANNTKFPLVTTGEMEHRRRRICNDDQLSKFPLFTIGKTEPRRRIRYPLTRERELDWPLEDQHLSAGIGTLVPPEDKSIKQEVGGGSSKQEVGGSSKQEIGGSSTAASSSNVPIIICQYCREVLVIYLSLFFSFFVCVCFNGCYYYMQTAAALEKKSDTTQMSLRLSMLKHYQCPWHLNQNTGAHPYVYVSSHAVFVFSSF